jgi:hypothetical protein
MGHEGWLACGKGQHRIQSLARNGPRSHVKEVPVGCVQLPVLSYFGVSGNPGVIH